MSTSTQRLTTNSLALFFRMALRLLISLYTTRVVLNVLGTEDYGIYVVVIGFSLMFSFVNASMGTAISRFLAYAIGKGETRERLQRLFSSALLVQIVIAGIILVTGGVVGYIFITHVLSIPAARTDAALILFFMSLIGLVFNILQIPYNATIIANEKMTAYAYIEVVNAVLLLAIALVLKLRLGDDLVVYGILLASVYAIIFMAYVVYCRRFGICRFKPVYDKVLLKPLITFSGADFFSNLSLSLQAQGQNVIFNKFYSLSANASIGIANQIYGAMLMFAGSITTAIRPQIIKNYAAENLPKAMALTFAGARVLTFVLITISVPLIIQIETILDLWLGVYPTEAKYFVAIILIMNATFGYKGVLVILIHATGRITLYSCLCGLWYLAAIPLQYLLARLGLSECDNYCVIMLLAAGNVAINLYFICRHLKLQFIKVLVQFGLPPILGMAICLITSAGISSLFTESIVSALAFGLLSVIMNMAICWFIVLDRYSRQKLAGMLSTYISRIHR